MIKEFWITLNRCNLPDTISFSEEEMYCKIAPNDDYFHVIEYSAYEKAIEVLKEIQSWKKAGFCPTWDNAEKVLKELGHLPKES